SIENKAAPGVTSDSKAVTLKWDNRQVWKVGNRELRASCQRALCINELTGEEVLDPSEINAAMAPTQITPLGNYAIGRTWNDGHSSGIYPYKRIKELHEGGK